MRDAVEVCSLMPHPGKDKSVVRRPLGTGRPYCQAGAKGSCMNRPPGPSISTLPTSAGRPHRGRGGAGCRAAAPSPHAGEQTYGDDESVEQRKDCGVCPFRFQHHTHAFRKRLLASPQRPAVRCLPESVSRTAWSCAWRPVRGGRGRRCNTVKSRIYGSTGGQGGAGMSTSCCTVLPHCLREPLRLECPRERLTWQHKVANCIASPSSRTAHTPQLHPPCAAPGGPGALSSPTPAKTPIQQRHKSLPTSTGEPLVGWLPASSSAYTIDFPRSPRLPSDHRLVPDRLLSSFPTA